MNRLTYNIELNNRPDSKGMYSVLIRIHLKGHNPGRVLTDVEIDNPEKHWNAKKEPGKWVKAHPRKSQLNAKIAEELERVRNTVDGWLKEERENNPDLLSSSLTPKELAERFRGNVGDNYFPLAKQILEGLKQTQAVGTVVNKIYRLQYFQDFAGENLQLSAVTPALLRRFQKWLQVNPGKRKEKLSAATINETFVSLSAIHKEILVSRGMSRKRASVASPFLDVDPLDENDPKGKPRLSENSIVELQATPVKLKTKRGMQPGDAFCIWLLSYYLGGARISDLLLLRYSEITVDQDGNPGAVKYQMYKTGALIDTAIIPEAATILRLWWKEGQPGETFVLPFLSNTEDYAKYDREEIHNAPYNVRFKLRRDINKGTVVINRALALLSTEAGLKRPITTHSARHSVADLARRIMESGGEITKTDIQSMLVHSDFKITEGYINKLAGKNTSKIIETIFKKK